MASRRAAPIWLNAPSRYAGWPARRAWIALGLLALSLLSFTVQLPRPAAGPPTSAAQQASTESDLELYATIVSRVGHGEDYYLATADELRSRPGYPLRPFVTFRLPTQAMVQAWLPDIMVRVLQILLALATAAAWLHRLRELAPQSVPRTIAALLLAGGLVVSVQEYLLPSHELWAALLIALSLASWRVDRWLPAVALALAAMLVRETAALYALVMAGFAVAGRRRAETWGWAAALTLFALAVIAHAFSVWRVTGPLDTPSDGWSGLSGIWFYAQTIRHGTVLEVFPFGLAAPIVALALFGWSVPRHPLAARMTGVLIAYGLLIALLARLNNFYWGLLVAPLFLTGLLFVPDGLRDLVRSVLDKRRITVTRVTR